MRIAEVLAEFDRVDHKRYGEHDVISALNASKNNIIEEDKEKLDFEMLALDFVQSPPRGDTAKDSFFGHKVGYQDENGNLLYLPNSQMISPEIIEYWKARASESINPILKARYSGLVWSFENEVCGNRPAIEICHMYIDSLLRIAQEDYGKYETVTYGELEIALSLSCRINDSERIKACKETLLEYEDSHAIDGKAGLWGYSFRLLIGNRKVNLSNDEETNIICKLEAIIDRLSQNEKNEPWALKDCAELLASYYHKNSETEKLTGVLKMVESAFDKEITNTSSLQAVGWLSQIYNLYKNYKLKEDSLRVLKRIQEISKNIPNELTQHSIPINISKADVDKYISTILDGNKDDILERIVYEFIPNKEGMKQLVLESAKKHPLMSFAAQNILDKTGRMVATVGAVESDIEGNIILQISRNLHFSSFILNQVFFAAVNEKQITEDDIMAFLEKTPLIGEDRKSIIKAGITAYVNEDYLSAVHLLIPQFEQAIRNLVHLSGGNTYKESRNGGFNLKTFDEVLRDDIILNALGEDWISYFRVLFTDQRGWNLRNDVCHGLLGEESFNIATAERVIHAILCLGVIRHKDEDEEK